MSTSVRAGLRACAPDARAAVVALADQPFVGAGAIERLVEAFESGARVAVATYGGEQRNPALSAREVWPLVERARGGGGGGGAVCGGQRNPGLFAGGVWAVVGREMSGDRGARAVLARHPELVTEVPCDDVADPADVGTGGGRRRRARGRG